MKLFTLVVRIVVFSVYITFHDLCAQLQDYCLLIIPLSLSPSVSIPHEEGALVLSP